MKKVPDCELYLSILSPQMSIRKLMDSISDLHTLLDGIHFDVMDGKFVESSTLDWQSPELLRKLKHAFPNLKYSVHLMTLQPESYIRRYIAAGAQEVFFHSETQNFDDAFNLIYKIRKRGVRAGIAINPKTGIENFSRIADVLDSCLIMSVQPGKGGQKFMLSSVDKVREISTHFPKVSIAVDGGINVKQTELLKATGARKIVVGSAILKQKNPFEAAYKIRKILLQDD